MSIQAPATTARDEFVSTLSAAGLDAPWLEPELEVARNYGLSERRLARALGIVRQHEDEIRAAWRRHFER